MLVCREPPFYYLPFARTASHTIWDVLSQFFTVEEYPHRGSKHRMVYVDGMEDAFVFASVRCPYSRAVSWYDHLRGRRLEASRSAARKAITARVRELDLRSFLLDPWIREHAWRPLSHRTAGIPVHYLLKYEQLAEGIAKLPFLRDKKYKVPRLHDSRRARPWYQVYQEHPGLAASVYEHCRPDFEAWGYSRDINKYI
jgi:hypothetical protein